jgi:hypothetical protein
MKTVQHSILAADACRKSAGRARHGADQQLYSRLQRGFLRVAEMKQWLHETEQPASSPMARSPGED